MGLPDYEITGIECGGRPQRKVAGGLSGKAGRQASGESGLHGSGSGLPGFGEKTLSTSAHCSGPFSRDPHCESSLSGVLERTGSGGIEESGLAVIDEGAPA